MFKKVVAAVLAGSMIMAPVVGYANELESSKEKTVETATGNAEKNVKNKKEVKATKEKAKVVGKEAEEKANKKGGKKTDKKENFKTKEDFKKLLEQIDNIDEDKYSEENLKKIEKISEKVKEFYKENKPSEKGDELYEEASKLLNNQLAYLVKRVSGRDRYETSMKINKFADFKSKVAIIASGENYADALMSQNLIKENKAKIYLVGKDFVYKDVIEMMNKDEVEEIYIIGGSSSIGSDMEKVLSKEVKHLKGDIKRIAGQDRYETARLINKELDEKFTTVAYVSGENFADALSSAPFVRANSSEMRMVKASDKVMKDTLPTFAIGGKQAINHVDKDVKRISGQDRYETSLELAKNVKNTNTIYIATGKTYADALSLGTILMNDQKAPNLLLIDGQKELTEEEKNELLKYKEFFVIGGKSSISEDVFNSLKELGKDAIEKQALDTAKLEAKKMVLKSDFQNENKVIEKIESFTKLEDLNAYVAKIKKEHEPVEKAKEIEKAIKESKERLRKEGLTEEEIAKTSYQDLNVEQIKSLTDNIISLRNREILKSAKEKGIEKMKKAGINDKDLINVIVEANTVDTVNAFVDFFIERFKPEKGPKDEDAEKAAALNKAKEEGHKALKDAGITSKLFHNALDKANTIEGVESYIKLVLEEHAKEQKDA